MQRISMAQKRINRAVDQIKADFNAGASLKFLARKYEVSAEVIRRNLIEWNLMSTERDASKVHNTSPHFRTGTKERTMMGDKVLEYSVIVKRHETAWDNCFEGTDLKPFLKDLQQFVNKNPTIQSRTMYCAKNMIKRIKKIIIYQSGSETK